MRHNTQPMWAGSLNPFSFMPKMIKPGINPDAKIHEATCRKCMSKYQYTLTDPTIRVKDSFDPRDGALKEVRFECQLCGDEVIAFADP